MALKLTFQPFPFARPFSLWLVRAVAGALQRLESNLESYSPAPTPPLLRASRVWRGWGVVLGFEDGGRMTLYAIGAHHAPLFDKRHPDLVEELGPCLGYAHNNPYPSQSDPAAIQTSYTRMSPKPEVDIEHWETQRGDVDKLQILASLKKF
ncbi:hypothetical protein K443DRAFT_125663 [Laccaria amethystina LaAM-08-1]|uniref:Uncharacterized protein n=1 Tax=Laccaria amethystina LaAM-08-1 TaxID=1095629 RepID=A0A0C9WWN8_9AGAR|nr:hypothetical protein K443DRAFT_125663 [Laccaria amethystina LaAM-08-1]